MGCHASSYKTAALAAYISNRWRTADLDGGFELQEVRLCHEYLLCSEAELADLLLGQLHLLAWTPISNIKQAVYDVVQHCLFLHRSGSLPSALPSKSRLACCAQYPWK